MDNFLLLGDSSPWVRMVIDSAEGQSFQVDVTNLSSSQLKTAFRWVEDHRDAPVIVGEQGLVSLSERDKALLENRDLAFYIPILDAAHFLGIGSLRTAVNQCIVEQMKGMSPAEMRQFLNEPDDLSDEEKDAFTGEGLWSYY